MSVRRVISLVVLLAAVCARAAAQQGPQEIVRENAWNPSLMHTQIVARYRGQPVLVFFSADWCGYCESIEKTLLHPDVRDVTRRFFLVKLSVEGNEATAHQLSVRMHHAVVFLDWEGNEVGRTGDDITPKTVALKLVTAAAANDLSAAKKLVELNYLKDAAGRYRAILDYAKEDAQKAEATKQLDAISKRADEAFRNIRDLVRVNRLGEAGDACEEYVATFPDNMHGDEVAKILDRLRAGRPVRLPDVPPPSDPDKQPDDAAELMLEKGMVQEWDRRYYEATETYLALTKAYPKSKPAAEADKRLKLFLEDPEMKRIIEQQKADKFCTRWLEMAALYEKRGLVGDAAGYYKRVIAAFPDTPYAAEAQKALDRLTSPATPQK